MKTITIRIPAQPHRWDIAKALADRDDLNRSYVPIKVPKLSYPSIPFRPTSLKAFLSQILP